MTTAAVAFSLFGGVIVIGGLACGADAVTIKFAMAIYLCIAVPLLLAVAISPKGNKVRKHRIFRASTNEYLEGKRVKRRLSWIHLASGFVGMVVAIMTCLAVGFAVARPAGPPGVRIMVSVLGFSGGIAACYLTLYFLKVLYLRLGWMTPEAASPFPFQMQKNRYPESWLEPIDDPKEAEKDRDD